MAVYIPRSAQRLQQREKQRPHYKLRMIAIKQAAAPPSKVYKKEKLNATRNVQHPSSWRERHSAWGTKRNKEISARVGPRKQERNGNAMFRSAYRELGGARATSSGVDTVPCSLSDLIEEADSGTFRTLGASRSFVRRRRTKLVALARCASTINVPREKAPSYVRPEG